MSGSGEGQSRMDFGAAGRKSLEEPDEASRTGAIRKRKAAEGCGMERL